MSNAPVTPPATLAEDAGGFLQSMDRELAGWGDPAARLARALRNDELVLYAQPILALRGRVQYPLAEVLVRLREEEQALLPPGEFLPVFEHFGMLPELDRWVVRHALARLARGSRIGQLSINVSGQTLADAAFAPFVAAQLAQSGVAAASLAFEIDEGDALAKPEAAATFAAAIKAAGCRVLLDGFGRRAASFAPLTRLRADLVKVDGVIVRRLPSSEIARAKLNAIVRVGQVIGLGIIAECVEDPAVLAQLRTAGVAYAQGFGIQRPDLLDTVAEKGV